MTPRIDQYWATKLGLQPELLHQPGIRVIELVDPREDNQAHVFVRDETCVISVDRNLMDRLPDQISNLALTGGDRSKGEQTLFSLPVDRIIGPIWQGFAEPADFKPHVSDRVRKLGPADQKSLRSMARAGTPVEWQVSGVHFDNPDLFGAFADGELVAIAHHNLLTTFAANIGVITHPAFRGRGFGKAATSMAMQDALDKGYLVLYQTMVDNGASLALAQRLGCKTYAQTLIVHFAAAGF